MIEGKRVLAIVPARAGSKRLPGKNLRPIHGKPLIEWTVRAGVDSAFVDRIVISTDDPAIGAACMRAGAHEFIERPADLAQDTSSVIDAMVHVLDQLPDDWDYVVLLQPTSPLRLASDIDEAISLCHGSGAPSVVGVTTLPKPEHFLCKVDQRGAMELPGPIRTQDGEPAFVRLINGAVYVGRPDLIRRNGTFAAAGTLAYTMPPERSIDIDTVEEFDQCEALLRERTAGCGADPVGARHIA